MVISSSMVGGSYGPHLQAKLKNGETVVYAHQALDATAEDGVESDGEVADENSTS